jgi:hypothetical protein
MPDDRSPETWHDPIVAEVRQAREALFAEANYDILEFCRRLSAKQATSGHPVVKRGSVSEEDAETAYPLPKAG